MVKDQRERRHEKILELYNKGYTNPQIAEMCGCSKSLVVWVARQHNLVKDTSECGLGATKSKWYKKFAADWSATTRMLLGKRGGVKV